MPTSPKTICPGAGCRVIVMKGERCEKHQWQKRPKTQYERERKTFRERGYDTNWTALSLRYRKEHPLCVMCLSRGRIKPATCVDHIIPIACCHELLHCTDNLQAACHQCNRYKALREPKEQWTPDYSRIVVCGLPGTGKTTFAKSTGLPYFDADEMGDARDVRLVQGCRDKWIAQHNSQPCVVIVASTLTAPHVAYALRGVVRHMTEQYVRRTPPGAL